MNNKSIISICVMISLLSSICIGCSKISDENNLGTSSNVDTSIITTTTVLETTETSDRGTISLTTVAMATNPITETATNTTVTTTENTTLVTTTMTSQITTTSQETTAELTETTSQENSTQTLFNLLEMTKDENSLPPLDDDLKKFFNDAFYTYYEFTAGGTIQIDAFDYIMVDDRSYSKVIDNRFSSIDEISNYLLQYFTQDFIDNSYILEKFVEQDGQLYTSISAKGVNTQYCGHTFEILDETDTEIDFQAIVYSYTATWCEDYYFINETPTVEHTSEYSKYTLLKTDNGWRFDTFSRIY